MNKNLSIDPDARRRTTALNPKMDSYPRPIPAVQVSYSGFGLEMLDSARNKCYP
jgi:hypothetical protein